MGSPHTVQDVRIIYRKLDRISAALSGYMRGKYPEFGEGALYETEAKVTTVDNLTMQVMNEALMNLSTMLDEELAKVRS